ncbi:MAG: APH(3') family aminoglycoside O-phosphotransferase [Polyangiaceae bacterium]
MGGLPLPLPPAIERELRARRWRQIGAGMSKADVFRFEGGLYLKTVRRDARDPCFGGLDAERAKLEWLGRHISVPTVVAFTKDETRDYLVMSEIPGRDAAADMPAASALPAAVKVLAAACREFHAIPTADDCPFVERANDLVLQARQRLDDGLVDVADFDAEREGRDPEELFQELAGLRPTSEDLVVTHGDFCLPNVILRDGQCSGFIDVGRASVADRWRDLSLCMHSIASTWGPQWSALFLHHYGLPLDERRREFFQLLDEFF